MRAKRQERDKASPYLYRLLERQYDLASLACKKYKVRQQRRHCCDLVLSISMDGRHLEPHVFIQIAPAEDSS